MLKATPWDDINFGFCDEVVYPTDHDFIDFRIFRFKKIFFINIFMNPAKKTKLFVYLNTC